MMRYMLEALSQKVLTDQILCKYSDDVAKCAFLAGNWTLGWNLLESNAIKKEV